MAALRLGERNPCDDTARLGGIVVHDGRFEMLSKRCGLSKLATEPAEKADRCLVGHACNGTAAGGFLSLLVLFGLGGWVLRVGERCRLRRVAREAVCAEPR